MEVWFWKYDTFRNRQAFKQPLLILLFQLEAVHFENFSMQVYGYFIAYSQMEFYWHHQILGWKHRRLTQSFKIKLFIASVLVKYEHVIRARQSRNYEPKVELTYNSQQIEIAFFEHSF